MNLHNYVPSETDSDTNSVSSGYEGDNTNDTGYDTDVSSNTTDNDTNSDLSEAELDNETILVAQDYYQQQNYEQALKLFFSALLLHRESVNKIDSLTARHPYLTGFERERANDVVQIGLAVSGIASCALVLGDHTLAFRIIGKDYSQNPMQTANSIINYFQNMLDTKREMEGRHL